MGQAVKAAHLSGLRKYYVGAALFRKNRLVSIGWNVRKTHPLCPTQHSQHAEFNVMVGLSKIDIDGATLYVARVGRNGKVCIAKPCRDCEHFLSLLGLDRIYYTNQQGLLEELIL